MRNEVTLSTDTQALRSDEILPPQSIRLTEDQRRRWRTWMNRHRVFLISDCLNPHRDRIGFPLTPGVHAEATQIGLCLDHLILQGRLLYQTAQEFLHDDAIIRFAGQQGLRHFCSPLTSGVSEGSRPQPRTREQTKRELGRKAAPSSGRK